MKYEEIHLWDFPPCDTYILLEPNFRKKLIASSVERAGGGLALAHLLASAAVKYGIAARTNNSTISDWKNGRSLKTRRRELAIPLWCLLEIAKLFQNEMEICKDIERKTIAYKDHEAGAPIKEPDLPIIITPEFDSIVFHLLADGNWGSYGKCAAYKQVDEKGRRTFVMKLNRVFGKFALNEANYTKYWQVLIPSIFVKIIRKYYGIPVLPSAEMDSLGEITSRLGYENSGVKLKAKRGYRTHLSDHFRLRLTHAGCKKLFSDMEELREKFPTCYLAQKQEKFEKMVAAWTRNPLAAAVA